MRRRFFLLHTCASAVNASRVHTGFGKIAAVAFDGLAVFDPRPIAKLAEDTFPGKGEELSKLWRTRQFEYTWLRTLSGDYADFWTVTQDALVYSTRALRLELTKADRDKLMSSLLALRPWPDTRAALNTLRRAGIRMALLSDFTPQMLNSAITGSKLREYFEKVFSCDHVRAYKPSVIAYQMAADGFRLRRDEIAFAAFAGWDAAGAKAFGFPTFWVNRANAPGEELGYVADATGSTLHDMVRFVLRK